MKKVRRNLLLLVLILLLGTGCEQNNEPLPPATHTPGTLPTASSTPIIPPTGNSDRGDVNLAHLNFLVEDATIAGQPMAITHIYSEFPRYEWVDASGEGIACIDDAARAALVYLEDYERTRAAASLDKARRLLNFVLYMQDEDGQFYNFILDRDGTINRSGNTSFKSAGWWAARAGRALAEGYRVMRAVDPAYASRLDQAFQRIRGVWAQSVAESYGKFSPVHGIQVPAWLIGGGSDVTSIVVLALLDYDRAAGGQDAPTRDLAAKLSEAISAFQAGDARNYPFGFHPDSASAPFSWHAWGSTQVFALARAGQQLGRPEWVASAKREADAFYARLLAGPMVAEWGVLPFAYPQIAYGVNSITQGYLALRQATGDELYSKLAGLTAGWFYGSNAASFAMYDPATGRGYDGLLGSSELRINKNAGAESTIEALMAIQSISADPVASRYLRYVANASVAWQVLEAENARQVSGSGTQSYQAAESTGEARWSNGHYILVHPGDSFIQEFNLPAAGSYYLYAAYLRQNLPKDSLAVEAIRAASPPAIDGDLAETEWSAAQPLPATTSANIVRGAAGWGGAERDAFIGYVMWDEQNLYIAAKVLSPTHRQAETGPSVWKGDNLWVYLNPQKDRSTVAIKLTLAQTPQGPEVWNWKTNSFMPGVKLAWKQGADFYTYEAALPWKSLGVDPVPPGAEMGLELGRGCCGSGFQDLSGTDPDVAANLVRMNLVEKLSSPTSSLTGRPSGPDAVALLWNLDGSGVRKQAQGGAPGRDYLWLERLTSLPVELAAGAHSLTLEYGGTDPQRSAAIDGFLLMPVKLTKSFSGPGGALTLTYDIDLGRVDLQER